MMIQESLEYEVSVTLSGSLLMFLFHALLGLKSLSWALWMVSVTIVILSFLDHIMIGWDEGQITAGGQILRSFWNLTIGLISALTLRFSVPLFLPSNVNPHSIVSILLALKNLYNLHKSWGALIYSLFLILGYTVFLSAVRAVVNLIYIPLNAVWHAVIDEPETENERLETEQEQEQNLHSD